MIGALFLAFIPLFVAVDVAVAYSDRLDARPSPRCFQSLGGVSIAMAHDVAEMTLVPRPPRGREEIPVQISRLLHAHEILLKEVRAMARQAAEAGDQPGNSVAGWLG